MEPENRDETRNPDGTFKPGVSGNPGGRPKNTLKGYIARKLDAMTDEEKEAWLEEHKISGIDQWKMAEGSPPQAIDHTSDGKALPTPILTNVPIDDSSKENTETH